MRCAIVALALWAVSPAFAGPIATNLDQSPFLALDNLTSTANVVRLQATSLDQAFLESASSGAWNLYDIWNSFLPSVAPPNGQNETPLLGLDDSSRSGSFIASALMACALFLQFVFIRRQSIGDFLILNGICGLYGFAVFLLKRRAQPKAVSQC